VGEDNVPKFKAVVAYIGIDAIMEDRFDHGMNILNLAIDQESSEIVEFLAESLSKEKLKILVSHRYGKGMQAIH
jgi:hypothetical protein